MKSYSSEQRGWNAFFSEARSLYASHAQSVAQHVRSRIEDIKKVEACISSHYGFELRDKDVLEIGPGQFLTQLTFLALNNRAVGVDLEIIAHGLDIPAYLRMLQKNGVRRTIKTVGRKLFGIDRRYALELMRQLHLERRTRPLVREMDACHLHFDDESFDFVYCRSVLHHIPEPEKVLREVSRVLRPGGVSYISTHLYTSETGSLDPRVFDQARQMEVRGWPHLRPKLHSNVRGNAYLNKLRLRQWRSIVSESMPEVRFISNRSTSPPEAERIRATATELRERGELLDYSLEELETFELVFLWRKPNRLSGSEVGES